MLLFRIDERFKVEMWIREEPMQSMGNSVGRLCWNSVSFWWCVNATDQSGRDRAIVVSEEPTRARMVDIIFPSPNLQFFASNCKMWRQSVCRALSILSNLPYGTPSTNSRARRGVENDSWSWCHVLRSMCHYWTDLKIHWVSMSLIRFVPRVSGL